MKHQDRHDRRVDKARRRAFIEAQMAGPMTISNDDPCWDDYWSSTPLSDTTPVLSGDDYISIYSSNLIVVLVSSNFS